MPNHLQSPTRGRFTLIELLVVISIIAVLAAMLLPALQKAKQAATNTQCMNGQRQIVLAIMVYADDNVEFVPNPWIQPLVGGIANSVSRQSIFPNNIRDKPGTYYDLNKTVKAFNPTLFRLWNCPAMNGAVPINDVRNTRDPASYTNYDYFAYREAGLESRLVYGNLSRNKVAEATIMLKDLSTQFTDLGIFRFNHGSGEVEMPDATNPSQVYRVGSLSNGWSNIAYYDGHVTRVPGSALVDIGDARSNTPTRRLWATRW